MGAEPTFRVDIENPGVHRMTVPRCKGLSRAEAMQIARQMFHAPGQTCHFHVVNERTGFTADSLTREGRCEACEAAAGVPCRRPIGYPCLGRTQ